jgi:calcium-binding protein CML
MGCASSKKERVHSGLDARVIQALKEMKRRKTEGDKGSEGSHGSHEHFNAIILKFPAIRQAFLSIRRVFKKFDQDGNNGIDPAELKTALADLGASMPEGQVNEMFKEANLTESGTLNFREFLLCIAIGCVLQLLPAIDLLHSDVGASARVILQSDGKELVQALQWVVTAYLLFDADASGTIDRDEVFAMIRETGNRSTRTRGQTSALLSEDRWRELDWDSDGTITFVEFLNAFYSWVGMDDEDEDIMAVGEEAPEAQKNATANAGAGGSVEELQAAAASKPAPASSAKVAPAGAVTFDEDA